MRIEDIEKAIDIVDRFDNETDPLRTCIPAREAVELLRKLIGR